MKSNPFKKPGCGNTRCQVCALGGEVDCKARGLHYKIYCKGTNTDGDPCEDEKYKGETDRSLAERLGGHMSVIRSKSEELRHGSFVIQAHMGKPQWRNATSEYRSIEEVPRGSGPQASNGSC